MNPVVVAVLGAGSAGFHHLRALRANGASPIAVPARPERRAALSAEGLATAADLAEAVRLGAAACVVATDTGRHASDAEAALALGLDVLIEKPLGVDAADARRVESAARKYGRRAFVGCVMRFSRSLAAFRGRLAEAGELESAEVECRSYLPDWRPSRPYRDSYSARAGEGGVLRDLIHDIDYAGWIFGWPAALSGSLHNSGRLGIESDEEAKLEWTTPAGVRVDMKLDYLTRPTKRGIIARGSRGVLTWDAEAQTVEFAGETVGYPQSREERFAAQIEAFLSKRGDERLAGLEDGVKALQICDAARRSSASGRLEAIA